MKDQTDYLTGKCLVAMPNMPDENFCKSVIYICSHSTEGAMGFVVNKKITEFSFTDLALQLPIEPNMLMKDIDLHRGGPLEKIRGFVLHSTDYMKDDSVVIENEFAVSSSVDVIKDIAVGMGPKENIIALGYASWEHGQLESEIKNNEWLVLDADRELVFRTKDEEKWNKAMQELGVDDIERLSTCIGRA